MKIYASILAAGFAIVFGVERASAIPPPDFLFAVGSKVGLVFSLLVVFLSTVLGGTLAMTRSFFARLKHKRIFWSVAAIVVLAFSVTMGIVIDAAWQQREYESWLRDSRKYTHEDAANIDIKELDISAASGTTVASSSASSVSSAPQFSAPFAPDKQPETENSITSVAAAPTPIPVVAVDPGIAFIERYYDDLGSGNIERAYAVSKKSVPLATFREWYAGTTGTEIESIQKIRDGVYSLVARIDEPTVSTRYAVLMTLTTDAAGTITIADSDVKALGDTAVATQTTDQLPEGSMPDEGYFDAHGSDLLSLTNADLAALLRNGDPFVLDAREDEEFGNGNLPGSHHVRFADLVAGEWIGLPSDRTIYVLCWSGIRGKEVAEFLRSKGIVARYLENGSDGWVHDGGEWDGNIKFSSSYGDQRYQIVFSTEQVRDYQSQGVVIVDSRPQSSYASWHIPGSINIPIIYTPTVDMEGVLNQVPAKSTVVTVCDDFVSCFDAKITGVKLERKGHTFLGRYNKPWEYRSAP